MSISIRQANAEGKKVNTHTQVPRSVLGDWARVKLNHDGTQLRQIGTEMVLETNFRRGCRLQDRGAVQVRGGSQWHVVAYCRGGREARLTWGGIRDHEVFLDYKMRGPAGTGRVGVSMVGGRQGQGSGKGEGVRGRRLQSPPCCGLRIYVCISAFCLDQGSC